MQTQRINNLFREFIRIKNYSKWVDEKNCRETWEDTVNRYFSYIQKNIKTGITEKEYKECYEYVLTYKVMPSMRALWSSGPAADADNLAFYNCSFTTIESLRDMSEILYILMNGCGAGFSVEKKYVNNIPAICETLKNTQEIQIIFEDSKLGWAEGFEKVLNCLWEGIPFKCDYSKLRPRGSILKTFGGRASGPEPLIDLVKFTTEIVQKNRGLQLQPIDVHDIICKIAEIVVVGGVRRSALISLSDLTDKQLATAKSGEFARLYPQRQLANNSVAYTRIPDMVSFLEEWKHLYQSKSGERGIFSRVAAQTKGFENDRRDGSKIIGTNPCGEVLLRSKQLCNLTEVIVRPEDTFETLKSKVKVAATLGTWQASFTKFNYVSTTWEKNCKEEALLGVSLTGLRDHPILGQVNDTAKKWLADLKHIAIHTNKKVATKININRAAAITCVKPSGTVSLLVDSSAGAHVRQTKTGYYLRRVRLSSTDPIFKLLKDQGMEFKCEIGQSPDSCTTWVVEFPCKAPVNVRTKSIETAKEQLEYWQMLRNFWCEHNPSITITVKEDEWLYSAAWVYENFQEIGGLTFFPSSEHTYQLAPFEDIDKKTYEMLVSKFPDINFSKLSEYEKDDLTEGSKEYACVSGSCELR